jgi:hypothetical protein
MATITRDREAVNNMNNLKLFEQATSKFERQIGPI